MSDHLTHLTAYNEWLAARAKGMRAEREFCFANFLSSKTLTQIAGTKRQLAELLSEIGFVKNKIRAREMERLGGWKSDGVALAINESWKDDGSGGASRTGQQRREPQTVAVDDWELIKAVMVAGLYPNVAKVAGENVNVIQLDGSEQVFVHPSSVNWGVTRFPSPFLIFNEKMKTSKVYLRDSAPVSPVALAFFGGKLVFDKSKKLLKMGTGHISFHTSQKVAGVVESARTALDEVLAAKIADPLLDVSESRIMGVIVDVVTDGRHSGATNYGK
ncbi:hypothetical protein BJ742DRAFT_407534 [Cladochytrium replicatum]|nr:hypothetical protein BJ742DRAFT_407534 [Cladochytrium replicatum]